MRIFIYIIFGIPIFYYIFITAFTWKTRKYIEGSLMLVMGKAGSGKSTLAGIITKKAIKKGRKVYSNHHVLGAIQLHHSALGMYDIQDSDIIIDEGQICYDSRDFKNFSEANKFFFSHFRHFGNRVYILSQSFDDLDVKIRRQAQYIYIAQPFVKGLLLLQKIRMKFGVSEDETDIVTKYKFNAFGYRIKLGFLSWKYFDSYSKPNLPILDNEKWGEAPVNKFKIKFKGLCPEQLVNYVGKLGKGKKVILSEDIIETRKELNRLKELLLNGEITNDQLDMQMKIYLDNKEK
jgi:energy-coupling factor transporter ATP-binding protein EcfA2